MNLIRQLHLLVKSWLPWSTFVARKCGHTTSLKFTRILAGRKKDVFTLKLGKDGMVEYCHHCLLEAIIPCAWCGQEIFPGEPITLKEPAIPKHIEYQGTRGYCVEGRPDAFIGCFRKMCVDTGIKRAGFWVMPGQVSLDPTQPQRS